MYDLFKTSGAVFSACNLYRYKLWREWCSDLEPMVWCCQNPSTADENDDDPSVRKMMGFARANGCGGIVLYNIFAYRATDERELFKVADPIGPESLSHFDGLLKYLRETPKAKLVVGWGNQLVTKRHSLMRMAYRNIGLKLAGAGALCLGTTKSGDPKHPLFVPYSQPLIPWQVPA